VREALGKLGERYLKLIRYMGGLTFLFVQTLGALRCVFRERREIVKQMEFIGVRSWAVVNITALFTGMVLALQSSFLLTQFGAKVYVGSLVSLSLVRELGPVLTSLMIAARVGSGITAEIGSMQVTEQVDAIRAIGANPVEKLVMPRMLATLVMLPLLTLMADVIGINAYLYLSNVLQHLTLSDLGSGLGKTFFFALIISLIGCYQGLITTGGTAGVGRSTTITVVTASILILVVDFFLTKLFLML